MSQRLTDLGYRLTASDLFIDGFVPRERIPFHTLDLNQAFAGNIESRFDVVVALELIEHLENPFHFMRQCLELLKPGGHLLVSTPNLANPVSQAMFVRSGMFQWFRDEDYRDQGHIMPIAPVVLRRCWEDAGFEQVWDASVSNSYRRVRSLRKTGTRWLARALSLVSGTPRRLRGEVYIAMLRKPVA
jgi:SAM-dependent methyltransferase